MYVFACVFWYEILLNFFIRREYISLIVTFVHVVHLLPCMIHICNISDTLICYRNGEHSVPSYCSTDAVTYMISDIGTYMKQYVPNMILLRNRKKYLAVYETLAMKEVNGGSTRKWLC